MTIFAATLPAQAAAGASATVLAGVFEPGNFSTNTVDNIEVVAPAGYTTVTGAASNNATITVRQVRAGTVVATIGALTTVVGTNLVAETPLAIPVTTQPSLQPGDVIDVVLSQNASGVAVGAGLVVDVYVD